MSSFAQIVINRTTNKLNKSLIYEVPDHMGKLPVGTRVYVPIGPSNEEGIIVGYEDPAILTVKRCKKKSYLLDYEGKERIELKTIHRVLDKDPWFTEEMLATAKAISNYYICPYGEALALFTINKQIKKGYERPKELVLSYITEREPTDLGRKKKVIELRGLIKEQGPIKVKKLIQLGYSSSIIKQVKELAEIGIEEVYKDTRTNYEHASYKGSIPLTTKQKEVYESIHKAIDDEVYKTFLLHGVTGSGKTQVYIQSAKHCLEKGNSAIILVPEISLTYQIVQRFVQIFGDEVVVFHSALTHEERYNNWERLRRGESHIIIGARSAIFAPLTNIGLIILDEEHDHSYKDWDNSHYSAKKVAHIRAQAHGCPLILGSATPSVESYYKAQHGVYELLELPERIHQQAMPFVELIDMKEEMLRGNYSVFSDAFRELITTTLAKKEQMIILLNRRGYSTFVMCRECGEAIMCPHCSTSLIYHKADEALQCHYCEHKEPIPTICPFCGSKKIKYFGSGTQRVEELLKKEFPQCRIGRIDQDIKLKKGMCDKVFNAFAQGEYDILLGTQMVSKGHDFPNVSAVGVITADSILNISNYSAAEQAFALLTQTAGRAGRGTQRGHVIIQTYNPTHYAIINSKEHNYKAFYDIEIKFREALGYPPFCDLIHIMVSLPSKEKALEKATAISKDLQCFVTKQDSTSIANPNSEVQTLEAPIEILGPYDEIIERVRDKYRYSIMIRGKDLQTIKKYIYNSWIFLCDGFSINVDPQ